MLGAPGSGGAVLVGIFRSPPRSMRAHDGHVIRDQRRKGVKEERGTRPCYQVRNERSGGVQEKFQRPVVKGGQGSTRPGERTQRNEI